MQIIKNECHVSENESQSRALRDLSNENLHERTLCAAKDEKRATLLLLEFLLEVDERRLYSAYGYASLWEYVHRALGYSESQTSERVAAMRLMRRVPEVKEKLSENKLTLTAVARLASFVRRESCAPEKTVELLAAVSEKTTREVERILASEQTIPVSKPDLFRPAGSETTRISFDADAEFLALYEELKNLQGRADWSLADRLKTAMRDIIERKKGEGAPRGRAMAKVEETDSKETEVKTEREESHTSLRAPEVIDKFAPAKNAELSSHIHSRYIPTAVKFAVRRRSGNRCEFVSRETGRRCEGRFGLQFDHIRAFALGGGSSLGNIRHLCRGHNQFAAEMVFGREKMRVARGQDEDLRGSRPR